MKSTRATSSAASVCATTTEIVSFSTPFLQFAQWLAEAKALNTPTEPYRDRQMALSTATPDGIPSLRIVLMQRFDPEKGRIGFYTNCNSRKGGELLANANAAALFCWPNRQVRWEGEVTVATARESDEYWYTRPALSRIASLASEQSSFLSSGEAHKAKVDEVRLRFLLQKKKKDDKDKDDDKDEEEEKSQEGDDEYADVPRPDHLGMFWLTPTRRLEFWQEGANRMHTRHVFEPIMNNNSDSCSNAGAQKPSWKTFMLQP